MVVGVVAVAASCPLDVLDGGVRGFGAGVGDPAGDEHLDGWPPGVQGGPEPVGLGGVSEADPVVEAGFRGAGVVEGGAGEEEP